MLRSFEGYELLEHIVLAHEEMTRREQRPNPGGAAQVRNRLGRVGERVPQQQAAKSFLECDPPEEKGITAAQVERRPGMRWEEGR